jgi:hypothetical protein
VCETKQPDSISEKNKININTTCELEKKKKKMMKQTMASTSQQQQTHQYDKMGRVTPRTQ